MKSKNTILTTVALAGLALALLLVLAPGAEAQASCVSVAPRDNQPAARIVTVTEDASVQATWCGGSAGYSGSVSLASPNDVFIGRGHVTPTGTTTDLGDFDAGDELMFKDHIHNTGYTWFTGPANRNSDGVVHAAITDLGGGLIHVGFEDLRGGGDNDYDDQNIVLQATGIRIIVDDGTDTDGDGIEDFDDNCINDPNPDQADSDGNGIGDACDPNFDPDTDGDGVPDSQDACPGFDDNADSDGDGVANGCDNCPSDSNSSQLDTDGDGFGNACDADDDNDGLTDAEENGHACLDSLDAADGGADGDVDGDGLSNSYEIATGTDPCNADTDGDGIDDGAEDGSCTDPLNGDTDGDGLGDGYETGTSGTDPCNADTDGDGIDDGTEDASCTDALNGDTDGDGLGDGYETGTSGTDPCNADTDGDGIDDGTEDASCTDALNGDTDGDGFSDGFEISIGTDPCNPDTDGDGIPDGEEDPAGCPSPLNADSDGDGHLDGADGDACAAATYEGHGQPLSVMTGLAELAPGDTGIIVQNDPLYEERHFINGVHQFGTAKTGHAIVDIRTDTVDVAGHYPVPTTGFGVYAGSELEEVHLDIPGLGHLEVRGVYADAYTSCDYSAGITRIREILIDGERVFVPVNGGIITGHNTIERIGQFEIRLNNEIKGDDSFTSTAFQLTSVKSGIDIKIGHAHTEVYHCEEGETSPPLAGPRPHWLDPLAPLRIEIPGL